MAQAVKYLLAKHEEVNSLTLQNPCKRTGLGACNASTVEERDRRLTGACWPTSSAELASSMFSKKPFLKNIRKSFSVDL